MPTVDPQENSLPRPKYAPEISTLLAQLNPSNDLTIQDIPSLRAQTSPSLASIIGDRRIDHTEREIRREDGSTILISIFQSNTTTEMQQEENRKSEQAKRACLLHIHGGGLISGNRFLGMSEVLDWVVEFDIVAVSVEYRLAPEHPFPAGLDDCAAALDWIAEHCGEFSVDVGRIGIVAGSGGAVLAAGLALKINHSSTEQRPHSSDQVVKPPFKLAGLLLYSPMLDRRLQTVSSHQYKTGGLSDRLSAVSYWNWYLYGTEDPSAASEDISMLASPGVASAEDLACLPPTYIDIGACDVHRDEAVEFASKIWQSGGECELHVWPGGCHIFSAVMPDLGISKECVGRRRAWVAKVL